MSHSALSSQPSALPLAPVVFVGIQRCDGLMPDFALYNLTEDIPGHSRNSTVSEPDLRKAGYEIPADLNAKVAKALRVEAAA